MAGGRDLRARVLAGDRVQHRLGDLPGPLYTAWSGGLPWNSTYTVDLTRPQEWWAAVIWAGLAWVVVDGARRMLRETGGLAWPWQPAPGPSGIQPDRV